MIQLDRRAGRADGPVHIVRTAVPSAQGAVVRIAMGNGGAAELRYYLGLGGNLGNVAATMTSAIRALRSRGDLVPLASAFYSTSPMGVAAGEGYMNAVFGVDSSKMPLEMLAACQAIEAECGRIRLRHWGPRTLDIDILLLERDGQSRTWETDSLTIPHLGLPYRRFVLDPLCEIAPSAIHPVLGMTVFEIRRWLLPRPLNIHVPSGALFSLDEIETSLPPHLRSRLALRTGTASAATDGNWLVDFREPADSSRPRFLGLADVAEPLVRLREILEAMTDEPSVLV